jgi:glycosyltransferase involved in cell wall biosynthesis
LAEVSVSVIIPTFNSGKTLRECLESLFQQEFSNRFEVILVDNNSTDRTKEIASSFPVLFIEKKGNRAVASNIGVSNARGDIVAFTDSDCILPKTWLKQISSALRRDPSIKCVGGLDLTSSANDSYFAQCIGVLEKWGHGRNLYSRSFDAARKIKACNVAYDKEALIRAGGFDESLPYWQELELGYRLVRKKYDLLYDPSIYVYHRRRSNPWAYFKQCLIAGSSAVIGWKQIRPFGLVAISLSYALLIMMIIMVVIRALAGLIIVVSLPSLYLLARSVLLSLKDGKLVYFPGLLAVLMINHLGVLAGILCQIVKNSFNYLRSYFCSTEPYNENVLNATCSQE